MNDDRTNKQIAIVNKAFHKIWFGLLLSRPDFYSDKMKEIGFIDMHIMSLAYKNPDLIMREIREHVKVPQTTLSSIVSKLEKLGFIRRVINRRDMRSYSIMVTEKGREVIDEHERSDVEQAEKVLNMLDEEEREDFVKILQKIISNIH